ncbi:IclR family transcriptional regulator [Salibacterium salarium]|uniref:IclR family transcriptional regulator n=1 Tax=Salibacterium salarium TaxID=284579 RepID=UPI0027D90D8C|nr:IclR family transcriptional regulator [Salibacterium salarium]
MNKTLIKSMDILHLFREHESLSLNDIMHLSATPKTSAYRMVNALVEMGFLEKNKDGQYKLGLAFLEFGQLVTNRLDLRKIAFPIMQRLRDDVKEAVNLVVKDQNEAIYIEKLDTNQPVRLFTKIGKRSPLYAGACPRILLAYSPKDQIEDYIKNTALTAVSSGTITNSETLQQTLVQTQSDGYTISHSELEENTTAVAAPIFDSSHRIIAGLSIAGPDLRLSEEQMDELIIKVKDAAFSISKRLGWKST